MKLCVFNGSPRKARSNTVKILNHFLAGYACKDENTFELFHLVEKDKWMYYFNQMKEADIVLIGFPLYVTAMPGIVKEFIEEMPKCGAKSVKVGFFIQSGFPESYQINWMEKYFARLTERLGYMYLGMIFQGFGASVEIMPESLHKKLLQMKYKLGRILGETGKLEDKMVADLKNLKNSQK